MESRIVQANAKTLKAKSHKATGGADNAPPFLCATQTNMDNTPDGIVEAASGTRI